MTLGLHQEGSSSGNGTKIDRHMEDHKSCELAREAIVRISKHEVRINAHELLDDTRMKSFMDLINDIRREVSTAHEMIHKSISSLNNLVLKGLIAVVSVLGASVISLLLYIWFNRNNLTPGP